MAARAQPSDNVMAYTVPQTAAALQVTTAHLYNLIQRGLVRTVRLGACRRIPLTEVRRLAGLEDSNDAS